jgi:hypothetical protein
VLSWTLQWGSELETLLAIQESTGMTPKGLQDRTELEPGCHKYWELFWVLSGARAFNEVGALPIAVSEIAALLGLVGETALEEKVKTVRIMQQMDRTLLAETRRKQEVKRNE